MTFLFLTFNIYHGGISISHFFKLYLEQNQLLTEPEPVIKLQHVINDKQ